MTVLVNYHYLKWLFLFSNFSVKLVGVSFLTRCVFPANKHLDNLIFHRSSEKCVVLS